MESIAQHQKMLDALRAKDREALIQILEANIMIGLNYIHNQIMGEG